MTSKRSEVKEPDDFHGGAYEAAVSQEKRDDCGSHAEPVEESDSGSEQEEVSVAALNVRTRLCVTSLPVPICSNCVDHLHLLRIHHICGLLFPGLSVTSLQLICLALFSKVLCPHLVLCLLPVAGSHLQDVMLAFRFHQ